MIRWLSIGVIAYMILGIVWWAMLLNRKNIEIYNLRLQSATSTEDKLEAINERQKQAHMILGEGIVLGLSLLIGIYIINRSASREIQNARTQNDFLLSVSHELKSPIAAIKLALQTLKRSGLRDDQKNQFLDSGVKDTERLEKMVQNILLSANIDEQPLELYKTECNITDMLHEIIELSRSDLSDFVINTDGISTEILLAADNPNLKLAVRNILDNAIKYADDNKQIKISAEKTDAKILIRICNSGCSITKKNKDRIFQKFYRGQDEQARTKEGTGLGLYIAHQIVKAHDGSIELKLSDAETCFVIQLPHHD